MHRLFIAIAIASIAAFTACSGGSEKVDAGAPDTSYVPVNPGSGADAGTADASGSADAAGSFEVLGFVESIDLPGTGEGTGVKAEAYVSRSNVNVSGATVTLDGVAMPEDPGNVGTYKLPSSGLHLLAPGSTHTLVGSLAGDRIELTATCPADFTITYPTQNAVLTANTPITATYTGTLLYASALQKPLVGFFRRNLDTNDFSIGWNTSTTFYFQGPDNGSFTVTVPESDYVGQRIGAGFMIVAPGDETMLAQPNRFGGFHCSIGHRVWVSVP
jgi:hypothetical protein